MKVLKIHSDDTKMNFKFFYNQNNLTRGSLNKTFQPLFRKGLFTIINTIVGKDNYSSNEAKQYFLQVATLRSITENQRCKTAGSFEE